MLELQDLRFCYPGSARAALNGLDLHVRPGQCLGLLGRNGAGKTTLLSLVAGVLPLQHGRIAWHGERRLGLVPQSLAFYPALSVRENLALFADLYGLCGAQRQERMQRCLAATALEGHLRRRAGRLSGGEQRRLNFAIGLLQPARLYLLDEATVGVDTHSRYLLLEAVGQLLHQGHAVIYTSHYLDEVERVAQRIVLLHEGRIHWDTGQPDPSTHTHAHAQALHLQWPHALPPGLRQRLDNHGFAPMNDDTDPCSLYLPDVDTRQLAAILPLLHAHPPARLHMGRPSLEQRYLQLERGAG